MDKVIKNINFLDLSTATEESLEGISMLKNINLIIYNKTVSKLLSKISMKNINASLEVPENIKLKNGDFHLDGNFSESINEPMYLGIKGTLIVKPDVTVEHFGHFSGITLLGDVYCPEKLKGTMVQLLENHKGNIITYNNEAQILVHDLKLDENYLKQLPNHTNIVSTGATSIVEHIDPTLLRQKIKALEVLKALTIREEIADALDGKIHLSNGCHSTIIPADAIYIDDDLILDGMRIQRFENAHLYVKGIIRFESDVTEDILSECIGKISAAEQIICRNEIAKDVMRKCVAKNTPILTYEGKLIVNDGDYHLNQAELKYAQENLTIINNGVLEINYNVEPDDMYNKIEAVHNYGVINGNDEQCGVIQTKLKTQNGLISNIDEDLDLEPANNEDQNVIANMNYLKL